MAKAGLVRVFAAVLLGMALPLSWAGAAPAPMPASAMAQPLDLEIHRGKVVYVDFWASWCVPCRQSFPWMNALQRQYGKDGFVILAVNMDQVRSDADKFLQQYPAEFAISFDPEGKLAKRFKVKGMPTSVLLDRSGKTLFVHEGFRLKDRDSLEKSIHSALH